MKDEDATLPDVRDPVPAEMLGYDEEVIATGKMIQEEGNKYFVSDKSNTSDDRFRHVAFIRIAQGTFNVRAINIAPETQRVQLQF